MIGEVGRMSKGSVMVLGRTLYDRALYLQWQWSGVLVLFTATPVGKVKPAFISPEFGASLCSSPAKQLERSHDFGDASSQPISTIDWKDTAGAS